MRSDGLAVLGFAILVKLLLNFVDRFLIYRLESCVSDRHSWLLSSCLVKIYFFIPLLGKDLFDLKRLLELIGYFSLIRGLRILDLDDLRAGDARWESNVFAFCNNF